MSDGDAKSFGESANPLLTRVESPSQKPPKPTKPAQSDKAHYLGHRERVRDRFIQSGADAMQDYELLEMLLFAAIKQGDTKPLAKALLGRFGSFSEVLGAPIPLLREVKGVGPATAIYIKSLQAAAQRYGKDQVMNKPVLGSWNALIDYCRTQMAFENIEQFRILFLDKKNKLIADEVQQTGTVDHTPVYPREVIKRSLELSATAIILVHNHPSGDPHPSRADIEMTVAIRDLATPMGIALHDHVIIGKAGHVSMKAQRLF